MSNFKSGSGNLDFGGSGDDEESETTGESSQSKTQNKTRDQSTSKLTQSTSQDEVATDSKDSTISSESNDESTKESPTKDQYPYFIRRNNVGDERDKRLEIHVRDKIADQESAFRSELAEQLGTNEVSKTDAREFALLAAFQHPERVAELMEEEGFGTF